jgi:hypothetical protein
MSDKWIDLKVTIWQRLHFKEAADMQEVIKVLKSNGPQYIDDDQLGFSVMETLHETEDIMTTEENNDLPTVEVYNGDELIWDNTQKQ